MKTGFRRKMYHKKLPPVEKETREERRKDELRYPWDNTQENIFRRKRTPKKKKKEENVREDIFPVHDPYGLYRPRAKRVHAPYPEKGEKSKYETMNKSELLTHLKAISKHLPRARSSNADIDMILEDLSKPLPKSTVADYVPATVDLKGYDYEVDEEFSRDPIISRKIKESKGELEEFDRMLDDRFSWKQGVASRPLYKAPPPPPPQVQRWSWNEDDDLLGVDLDEVMDCSISHWSNTRVRVPACHAVTE